MWSLVLPASVVALMVWVAWRHPERSVQVSVVVLPLAWLCLLAMCLGPFSPAHLALMLVVVLHWIPLIVILGLVAETILWLRPQGTGDVGACVFRNGTWAHGPAHAPEPLVQDPFAVFQG